MAIDRTEEINAAFERKMTDTGTRYEHYRELLSEWETGLDILKERIPKGINVNEHVEKAVMLAFAIDVLQKNIDVMCGFTDTLQQYKLSRTLVNIEQEAKVWRSETGGSVGGADRD